MCVKHYTRASCYWIRTTLSPFQSVSSIDFLPKLPTNPQTVHSPPHFESQSFPSLLKVLLVCSPFNPTRVKLRSTQVKMTPQKRIPFLNFHPDLSLTPSLLFSGTQICFPPVPWVISSSVCVTRGKYPSETVTSSPVSPLVSDVRPSGRSSAHVVRLLSFLPLGSVPDRPRYSYLSVPTKPCVLHLS